MSLQIKEIKKPVTAPLKPWKTRTTRRRETGLHSAPTPYIGCIIIIIMALAPYLVHSTAISHQFGLRPWINSLSKGDLRRHIKTWKVCVVCKGSSPMVEIKVVLKASSEKRNNTQVFPTPESPIRRSLNSRSYVFFAMMMRVFLILQRGDRGSKNNKKSSSSRQSDGCCCCAANYCWLAWQLS